jgi:hypothetical protein
MPVNERPTVSVHVGEPEQDQDYILSLFDPPEDKPRPNQDAVFDQALETASRELAQEHQAAEESGGLVGGAVDLAKSIGVGIAQSLFETKDFIAGEPTEQDKSGLRRGIEAAGKELAAESSLNAVAIPVAQFVTGLVGAGKFVKGAQAVGLGFKAVTRGGKAAAESVKAAAAGAVVFDPHEERLSNVLKEDFGVRWAVTDYLAADPTDSAAEGRFKTALESLGMDAVMLGTFAPAVKAYRAIRGGRSDEAVAAAAEAEHALSTPRAPEPLAAANDPIIALFDPPEVKPLTTKEAAEIYNGALQDSDALARYGSRQAAIAAGYTFAKADLPWQMWSGSTPDELNAFVARVAETREAEFIKAKGGATQSDAMVNRMVAQRAELWGESPEVVLGQLQTAAGGATKMAAHAETATVLGLKAMDEADQVVRKIRMGNLEQWGGDRATALADFKHRAAVASALMSYSRSFFSSAGRTLRRARGDVPRLTAEELTQLDNLPADRLAKLFEQADGDVGALKSLLSRPSMLSKIADGANFLLVNNLLWGSTTHIVNLSSTVFMMAARPAQRAIGATVQQSLGIIGATDGTAARTQALRQYRYMASSLIASARMAGKAFVEGESVLTPYKSEWTRYATASPSDIRTAGRIEFKPVQSVEDVAHNAMVGIKAAIGLPTRALGFVDELTRQMSYRGMVMAEASIEAERLGLVGAEYQAFIRNALENSLDESGAALNARASQEAKTVNFQQDLTKRGWGDYATAGNMVQGLVSGNALMRQVIPFVRTPINVLREGVRLTPGLNLLQREFNEAIRGKQGVEAQAQAIGQMSMGTLFLGAAAALVDAGMFTGSGPNDPVARRNLIATGWKPNSIVWQNEDGSTNYFQLGRFDPIGLVFGTVADLLDIAQHPDKREVVDNGAVAVLVALTHQLRERTYVQNFIHFLDALSDPSQNLGRFAGRQIANLVPMSSAFRNYGGQSMDYLREARTLVDHAIASTPGLSASVPLRYDAFGDPIRVRRGPWSTVEDSVVNRELIRMSIETDLNVGAPSSQLAPRVDLRDLTLEDGRNAYEAYQQYAGRPKGAPPLKDAVAKLIQSPAYQASPDGPATVRGTRQWMLHGVLSKYREAAKNRLIAESAVVREARVSAARKVAAERAAKINPAPARVAQQQSQEQTAALLASFGLGADTAAPSGPHVPNTTADVGTLLRQFERKPR